MQFKQPEILYALFLLLLPIFIHLFQLRRFKKVPFTNVAFLQAVVQSSRKSSQLKKWLVLALRLLAITGLVLAFAQPYLPISLAALQKKELVVVLDNSFSMQAQGSRGPLLTEALQDLITIKDQCFTLLTLDGQTLKIDVETDGNELLNIDYTTTPLDQGTLALKIGSLFAKDSSSLKQLVYVSDFRDVDMDSLNSLQKLEKRWVQLQANRLENAALDSIDLQKIGDDYQLQVFLKTSGETDQDIPISLYNGDRLIAKATATPAILKENKPMEFRIASNEAFQGRIEINDQGLPYDNIFYFNLEPRPAIQVLSINNAPDGFLKRLFNGDDFEYRAVDQNKVDYSIFGKENVIILNELSVVPPSLLPTLSDFVENGGRVILIPNTTIKASTYDGLLQGFKIRPFGEKNTVATSVSTIDYDHPLYKNVFLEPVKNFQQPSIAHSFILGGGQTILGLENGNPFLVQGNGIYVFAAALNIENTNFQDSPLIVPTFLEMAKSALALPKFYYFLNQPEAFEMTNSTTGEDVYSLQKGDYKIIPMQERRGRSTVISTQEGPYGDGIYEVLLRDSVMGHVAYNYKRTEKLGPAAQLKSGENVAVFSSLKNAMGNVQEASSLNLLYKWFVIFALLMLVGEMLVLKFLK